LFTAIHLRAGDWPQWRGPIRTGYPASDAPALNSLPAELKPLWKISIGGGFSSPVLAKDKLVYLDENGEREVAHLVDAKTGKEIWRVPFASRFEDEWGAGPRSTPLIDDDRVYALSCNGEFRCLRLADGQTLWGVSFEKDFGVKFVGSKANEGTAARRGNNGSVIVDGDAVIVPVGSINGASLVCFDKLTGKVIWKTGNDEAGYSSPMVATLAGVKQVVVFTADALMGVERASGKILWRVPLVTNAKRHAATPVIMGDRVIVNSHSIGLVCFEITRDSGGFKTTEAWANKKLLINLSTPVLVGPHLYCQGPQKDYVCVEAATGRLLWSQPGFGSGKKDNSSTIVAGRNLLVLAEDGQLILVAADSAAYRELGRLQVCGNTWSFPAYADGKLYVRDGRQLLCVDLAKGD
jgi:outer membrane protein assembly factor BamB